MGSIMNVDTLQAHKWAMDAEHLRAFIASVAGLDRLAFDRAQQAPQPLGYETVDGVAYIDIVGPMIDRVPAIWRAFGVEAADLYDVRQAVLAADSDQGVNRIVLRMDTPGGTVSGTDELANAIASTTVPVFVHASGMLASAGMWAASAANEISATPMTAIGSIGVYSVIVDSSQAAEDAGYKVHVVSSGGVKGAGVDGAPVSDEAIEAERKFISKINDTFVDAVANGRGLSVDAVRAINTGEVWIAADAASLGLIDYVTHAPSIETTQERTQKETAMNKEIITLVAAHPEHGNDIGAMVEAGASVADIRAHIEQVSIKAQVAQLKAESEEKDEEMSALKARVEELEEENEALKTKLAEYEDKDKAEDEQHDKEDAAAAAFAAGFAADPGVSASSVSGSLSKEQVRALDPAQRFAYFQSLAK